MAEAILRKPSDKRHPNFRDLTGMRFRMLSVLEEAGIDARGRSHWLCRCDCGNTKIIISGSLIEGKTVSCGCYATGARIHNMTGTPTHQKWMAAKNRCAGHSPRSKRDYVDRGIRMCDEWKDSFEKFLRDMGECPEGMTLDRINNDKGYEPGNCRWATRSQQQRNRRCSIVYEVNGVRAHARELAERFGMPAELVMGRLKKGWDIEDALKNMNRAEATRLRKLRKAK